MRPQLSAMITEQPLSVSFPYDGVMAVARYPWERNLTLCRADFVIDSDLCFERIVVVQTWVR